MPRAAVTKRGVFLEAYRRLRRHMVGLPESRPETAVYLAGYLLEFRLKVAICEQNDADQLDASLDERLAQRANRKLIELRGKDGHDLDLLWHLAGLDRLRAPHYSDLVKALRWDVAWRYQAPAAYRGSSSEAEKFYQAVLRLCDVVESEEGR